MSYKKSVLCFFHFPCPDGATAAVALKHRLIESNYLNNDFQFSFCPITHYGSWDDLLPINYVEKNIEPKYEVHEIFIVDICLSEVKLNQIINQLRYERKITTKDNPPVICIDHHKTALEKINEISLYCNEVFIKIAPGMSGATLVWEYCNIRFNEDKDIPLMLKYVADQDLWEWELENSKEVNATINLNEDRVEGIENEFIESINNSQIWLENSTLKGIGISAMIDSQTRKTLSHTKRINYLDTHLLITNATSFASETGNLLCEEFNKKPNCVAVIYTILDSGSVRCSFRSISGGNKSAREIAEMFGGGGHENAAGCRFNSFLDFAKAFNLIEYYNN
ncbi:MAG: hypothetical protein IPP08_07945 [Chlorobiota bacterium]|nr:hypothetical protein [Chlorobiota bacterium]QQS65707.1 MAG: hypothetical protein IPP08_07945 [Chlorobiota bacterium]